MNLDPELFDIKEQGELRLITPSHHGAVGNGPWSKDTIQYRSRVETVVGGLTVSQGFKKFFNLACGPEKLQIGVEDIIKACTKNAVATLKIDGSLLIRSVWHGKVMFRTRGSFGYEHLDNAHEMLLFYDKYPLLFDPTWYSNASMLLEWTSPHNVIVLKYDEPDLTLVGAISNLTLRYVPMDGLKWMARDMHIPLVDHFYLTADGWHRLQTEIETNDDIEGYVIRLNDDQDLVKVKCLPYLTKHGLKSTLTTDKLVDMYFQQGRPTFNAFCEKFCESFDEETFMWALGAISSLYDGVRAFTKIETHMLESATKRQGLSRKDAAMAGKAEYGQTKRFSAYMNMWEGKPVKVDLLKSILLQNTKQVEMSMFKESEYVPESLQE